MFDQLQSSDPSISRKVGELLSNRGMRSPCRIVVATKKGRVTLSGVIQYEYQRRIAVHATGSIAGVQSVQDQLQVIPKKPPARSIPAARNDEHDAEPLVSE
jgi:osmotically-inducible protein OsmY